MTDSEFRRLRRLSVVPRWSIVPTIRRQTVAEHTFHVCAMALWVAYRTGYAAVEGVLLYALRHDGAESVTGDIPSTLKRALKGGIAQFEDAHGLNDLTVDPMVKAIVKIADYLEALFFLLEEKNMGNQLIEPVYADVMVNARKAWMAFPWHDEQVKPDWREFWNSAVIAFNIGLHPGMDDVK